jgi:hypothetical protein
MRPENEPVNKAVARAERPVRLVAYFVGRFWPGEGKVEARDEPARGWCRIGEGPACKTW